MSAREIVKSALVLAGLIVGAYAAVCLVIGTVLYLAGLWP